MVMNRITLLATRYKQHFYDAEVDQPKGFQMTLVLMGLFLMAVVSVGFSSPEKAVIAFIGLALFFAVFPYIFPRETE
jgi:hypothetical protein